MKQLILYSVFFFSLISYGQMKKDSIVIDKKIDYKNFDSSFDTPFDEIEFKVGSGVFIPKGKLISYFGISPIYEMNLGFPLEKGKAISLVLQLAVPNQKQDFIYLRTLDTIKAKSALMINVFGDFKKSIHETTKSKIELSIGIGASIIRTDARNPFYSGGEDEEKYEKITSILLSPGIKWSYHFTEKTKISFELNLHYSPYKIEGALREEIGSLGIIPKVLYTF